MKKEFVTYPLALRMKALGFDEPCFGYYLEDGEWQPASYSYNGTVYPSNKDLLSLWVSAPLYQQAFRWFRKNYYFLLHYDYGKVPHCTIIQKLILEDGLMTYEKAEFACLEKLIGIVEQSKSE